MVKFEQNTVYNAETEKEAEWILKEASKQGYKWSTGAAFKTENKWEIYNSKTCYDIMKGQYTYIEYYQEYKYKIVKVKDLTTDKIIDLW